MASRTAALHDRIAARKPITALVSAMFRVSLALVPILILIAVVHLEAQSTRALAAPTFYIAASGVYNKFSANLAVTGASNLPPGSRLNVTVSDFVGYQSSIISEDAVVVLN